MPNDRYEINHNGELVISETELCAKKDELIQEAFSQFGWALENIDTSGPFRKVKLYKDGCSDIVLNIFSGNIRNESRSSYEKKIQLNGKDPRPLSNENTIILGVYVYKANDCFKDAIFVGYPIDMQTNYPTNPSIRGAFVDKVLFNGKNKGFYRDAEKNIIAFRPEFIFYYLDNYKKLHYNNEEFELDILPELFTTINNQADIKGQNILIYGVPGCGKSHYIKENYNINDDNSERVVFHPDYTYSDFVGQILPKVKTAPITTSSMCENEVATYGTAPMMVAESPVAYGVNKTSIEYDFTPGPFTRLLKRCKEYSDRMHYLVIEEVNRGNAPAIFGEIFQLLDRGTNGESEYGINNSDIADKVYGDPNKKVIIPNNLTVLATMNTADQNVFTLDTAFKRRWEMLSIRNNFKLSANDTDFNAQLESTLCGTKLTWMKFATAINSSIVDQSESNLGSEDKRLGHFFVKPYEMEDVNKFSEKVIMYLWNDVFKFEKDNVFNSNYKTLEDILDDFQKPSVRFKVFAEKLGFSEFIVPNNSQAEGDTDE